MRLSSQCTPVKPLLAANLTANPPGRVDRLRTIGGRERNVEPKRRAGLSELLTFLVWDGQGPITRAYQDFQENRNNKTRKVNM